VADKTKVININSGEPYDIYIGHQRSQKMWKGGYYLPPSPWRNPHNRAYRDGWITAVESIDLFYYDLVVKRWVNGRDMVTQPPDVQGKVLACWCKPSPCHGDVLARLADALDVDPASLTPEE
jgi:hypothetical protein